MEQSIFAPKFPIFLSNGYSSDSLKKHLQILFLILSLFLYCGSLSVVSAKEHWKLGNTTQYYKIPWSPTSYIFPSKNHARHQACDEWIQGAKAAGYTGPFINGFLGDNPYQRYCLGYYRYPSIKRGPFYPNAYASPDDPLLCQAYEMFNESNGTCVTAADISEQVKAEKNQGSCPVENGGKNTGPFPIENGGKNTGPFPIAGNPIHTGTGNKFQKELDYVSNYPGGIQLIRSYNSLDTRIGRMGYKWRHNYDRRIVLTSDSTLASVIRADGKSYKFVSSGGVWTSDPDVTSTLEKTASGWTYRMNSGVVEYYRSDGYLGSIIDQNGRTLTLTYITSSKLGSVTDEYGKSLVFSYDSNGRVVQITTPVGNFQYAYDLYNNLSQVTYPDGATRQYLYENSTYRHALTGIIDERGIRYATYAYNSEGRAISSEHAGGVEKVTLSYNADGTTIVTNSRNISSTYGFLDQHDVYLVSAINGPGCSSCGTGDSSFQYDPTNNNLLSKTIHGLTTTYGDHDSNGNPGYKIEAVGTPSERRIDYTYDPRFASKIKTVTEASVYSSGNKVTTYDYDNFGNTTQIRVDGFTPAGIVVAREINLQYLGPLNQLSQIDGPRTDVSDVTTLEYYPNDPVEGNNRARLKRVTSSGIVVRDNLQYNVTGKVVSEARPNGLTVSYSYYPGNDRLQTVTESVGTIGQSTQWTYLATGEVEAITRGYGTPEATTLTFGYDGARRLTSITDGLGNKIQYTIDTEGNKEKEEIFDTQNTLQKSLAQTFDDYNRLNLFTQANENRDSDFAADGTLDKITDGNGTVTDYSYDALKRLVATTQDLGGTDTSTQNALTQYGYDVGDHLTSVIDPTNGNTTYVYDDLGNLLSQTNPDTGTTTFTHDAAGNVLTRLDAKGQSFAYNYDAFNRLTSLDAPGTTDDITYTYDSCANGIGRLCSVVIGAGAGNKTTTYTYTALGDITSHQGIGYSHDHVGRTKTISYPSGNVVTYTYNAAGQVSQVDLQQGTQTTTLASGISYAPFGPVTALTYGNGHTLSQGVDTAYRYTDHTITGALQLVNSLYDANGNLRQVDNSLTTVSNIYSYDALNRVATSHGASGSQEFGYDKNGNRLQFDQDGNAMIYGYETNSNRLDIAANDDVVLDPNGNITTQGSWTYTHTAHNRLASVSNDSLQVGAYVYNGLGQRVSKSVDSITQSYVYGLNGELLQETDGTTSVEYVYLNGQPLAVIWQGDVYYLHNDHLGSPRVVTDAAKTVVWHWDSDPFGATPANEDPDNDGNTFILNLRFPGQYYDSESGLHYNYFRYYDPRTGRYITSDPIGLVGGLNTYGYVGVNPVRYIDPFGLDVYPSPDETVVPQKPGPFGGICGPEGLMLATWIPDITKGACNRHDNCYMRCADECGDWKCKYYCDSYLFGENPLYGLMTGLFGGTTYDGLKEKNCCGAQ